MSLSPQTRLTDDERANLVAFLDGEVDESLARSLEDKAARSVSVRREIEALDKTWGLLDWLPRPELPAEFAAQTLTQIHARQEQAEQFEGQLKSGATILAKTLAWALCVVAIGTVGFMSMRYLWPDPNRALINDLDAVENLDTYRAIPDIKFLDDLSRLGIFVEPASPEAGKDAATQPAAEQGSPMEPEAGTRS
jgi:hypothetical protein